MSSKSCITSFGHLLLMNNNRRKRIFSLVPFLTLSSVFLGLVSFPSSASANSWAGSEKSGSCYIPGRTMSFDCIFGPYGIVDGARQIGGFYVNPRHESGADGTVRIAYQVNGGEWVRRDLVLNSTSDNYVDFGDGVSSFKFKFLRPSSMDLEGGTTTNFTFNYDLDR
jgi:hypothetical protein